MKAAWVARARALFFPLADPRPAGDDRSIYERFAIPHTFKPQLSFAEALVAAAGAFLRIFLGSLVFAFWGAYSLAAWTAIRSSFWRVAAVLLLFLLFLLSFASLMIAIAVLVRMFWPRRSL